MQYLAQQIKWCSLAVMLSMTFSYATWAQQSAPQPAHKLHGVYDTFNGKSIDPSKWISNFPQPCGTGSALECVREIEDGRLHIRVRNYGADTADQSNNPAHLGLLLTAPSGVMDIATGVVVRKASAQGCPDTDAGPRGQIGLVGAWFNRGQAGAAADDVFANIYLETSSEPGVLAVVGHVGFDSFPVGEVRVGERVILELVWEQPNHRFIARLIRLDHNTVAVESMPYEDPDGMPPVAQVKGLFLFTYAPNCSGTRPFIDVDTLFDNVTVGR